MESLENLMKYVGSCSHSQVATMPPINLVTVEVEKLTKLIDAIEQEHAKLLDEARSNAWNQGFDDGYSDADEALGYREDDLAEHGYYRWKNADGETIHIGDKVSTEEFGEVEVEGFIHNAVAFYNYSGQPAYLCTSPANLCRHHHEPTVEDVLRDYATRILIAGCIDEEDELVAEYAKKLRLAGDGE